MCFKKQLYKKFRNSSNAVDKIHEKDLCRSSRFIKADKKQTFYSYFNWFFLLLQKTYFLEQF